MSIITRKATIAIVKIGKQLEFEGLRFDDNGEYAVAVPQICSMFSFLIHNASRDVKAILGAGFQFLKARTTLHPKAVNCITLLDFEKVVRSLFGKTAAKLCAERSCSKDELRSTHSAVSLVLIDRIEGHAVRLIDRGMEPQIATDDAIEFYS